MKRYRILTFIACFACLALNVLHAQEWLQVHTRYDGYNWTFPYRIEDIGHVDMNEWRILNLHTTGQRDIVVPYTRPEYANGLWEASVDSLTLCDSVAEADKGKDKYKVFAIHVTTADGAEIKSKENYVPCFVSLDARGQYQLRALSGRIRGRGNSTWEWYDKKPYRIKFDQSCKMFGIEKNKDWVLLANWRDVTKVMNTFCSLAADYMGLPFTTPIRFAELFINGKYNGLYQVAEQVEVGGNRVDIDEAEGILLTLDADDGPNYNPDSGDNFWSSVYRLPVAVKWPKEISADQLNAIRDDFAKLESAIKVGSYHVVDSLLDLHSFIAMLHLQELAFNVEIEAPRSLFLFKDKGGKYTFGPAWDWDAGFDFSWADMMTGHTYFGNYQTSLLGTDPYRRRGARSSGIGFMRFFTDMFQNRKFVEQYKAQWASYNDSLVIAPWKETVKYIQGIVEGQYKQDGTNTSPQRREDARWPVGNFKATNERNKMHRWLLNRLEYLNDVVEGIPLPADGDDPDVPDVPSAYTVKGTLVRDITLQQSSGYKQDVTIQVSADEVAALLGLKASDLKSSTLDLVPLDANGAEGSNTAAKTYGAWFDDEGNTTNYSSGYPYVFIESDQLFSWACGCHPENSWDAEPCTVTMQYRHDATSSAVNVKVNFEIESSGWWWDW